MYQGRGTTTTTATTVKSTVPARGAARQSAPKTGPVTRTAAVKTGRDTQPKQTGLWKSFTPKIIHGERQCNAYTRRLIGSISYLGARYITTKVTKCIREKMTLYFRG